MTGQPKPDERRDLESFRLSYQIGHVSGIDVLYFGGTRLRCFAFVGNQEEGEIQVFTDEQRLQSALEAAAIMKTKVEVSFAESGPSKELTRVRLLDRGPQP